MTPDDRPCTCLLGPCTLHAGHCCMRTGATCHSEAIAAITLEQPR